MDALSTILIEVSSRKGSYLTGILQMKQSPSTCLRIISSLPVPVCNDKEIIGIDDWAFRKGVSYGTIVVDAMSGHPIDLIESREESEVTLWLKNHQEVKIVTRDRASSYSKAITTALPSCDQIADRFHIVKNLLERIYDTIKCRYSEIKKEFIDSLNEPPPEESPEGFKNQTAIGCCRTKTSYEGKKANASDAGTQVQKEPEKKEILYNKIHDLHSKGLSSRRIAAALQVNKETVLIYLKYDTYPTERIVLQEQL